jgi:uncharacterized protein (DUF58 family)
MAATVIAFALSFGWNYLFPVAQFMLIGCVVLLVADVVILFLPNSTVVVSRRVNKQLSLGDENPVTLTVLNRMRVPVAITIYDEVPYQLQWRNFKLSTHLGVGEKTVLTYEIRPTERGVFHFGNVNVFCKSFLRFAERRIIVEKEMETACYPSVLQMRKYELKISNKVTLSEGIKKIRRLGHNNEFEQIKLYVKGDDYRSINWKATSRKHELMVNQFQDEKSQQVYCIIDKSRVMKMAFDGLTLLDHSINSALVISNTALIKYDRAGVLTFSDKIGSHIQAERTPSQLKKILELLYRQKTNFLESNYELLHYSVQKNIKGRSLLFLFSNFESQYSLQRALPVLRKISQRHLLVVIFFHNTAFDTINQKQAGNIKEVYLKTMTQKFAEEKKRMVQELRQYGIQTILTTPKQLSIDTINKYLELKSRGMI